MSIITLVNKYDNQFQILRRRIMRIRDKNKMVWKHIQLLELSKRAVDMLQTGGITDAELTEIVIMFNRELIGREKRIADNVQAAHRSSNFARTCNERLKKASATAPVPGKTPSPRVASPTQEIDTNTSTP